MKKQFFKPFLLVISSLCLTLFLCEVGYRCYLSNKIQNGQFRFLWVREPIYKYDVKSGYQYIPNKRLRANWVEDNNTIYKSNILSFNQLGHRSSKDYGLQKKSDSFRIVVVGDSLSACIHNNLSWPDALAEQLRNNSKFSKTVGNKQIEVLNLARDGIGLAQFPALIEHEVLKLRPDLILVNFITADIYRRFIWRKSIKLSQSSFPYEVVLNCTRLPAELSNPNCSFAGVISMEEKFFRNPESLKSIKNEISKEVMAKIHWTSLYPEFLNFLLQGKLEQILAKNPYTPKSPTYETREGSLEASSQALHLISAFKIPTLYLHLPVYWEMIYNQVPKFTTDLMALVPEIPIVPMVHYLPKNYSREDIDRWTNSPQDMHFSDQGAQLYAKMVLDMLEERFQAKNAYLLTD